MALAAPRVQADAKPLFKCPVPKSSLGATVRFGVKDALQPMGDQYVMRRMLHSSGDIKEDTVYGNNFVFHAAGHIEKMNPMLFCTAEVRFVITGQMLVMGFKIPEMRGLLDFAKEIQSQDASTLCATLEGDSNFAIVLKPGTIAALPSGFVYISYVPTNTAFIRFSFSPALDGEDTRVTTMVETLLTAMPQYRDSVYSVWLDSFKE